MQITQQHSAYGLMTNFVKFVQQMTLPSLSEGDSNVCNSYLMKSTYIRDSPRVKANAENIISGTNTSLLTFTPFTDVSFINDCLLQPMLHVNHPLLQFAHIMDYLLSTAALFSRFYGHMIQT